MVQCNNYCDNSENNYSKHLVDFLLCNSFKLGIALSRASYSRVTGDAN